MSYPKAQDASIVEETLTSGEYVSLFLISILNMNIWNSKNYVTMGVIYKEKHKKLASRKNYASEEIKCTIFLLFFKWHQLS